MSCEWLNNLQKRIEINKVIGYLDIVSNAMRV
jgi:hypothetical protein